MYKLKKLNMRRSLLLISISVFIITITSSCDEGTGTNTEDALLKKELIGTWNGVNNGSVLTFNKNGTFIESAYSDQANKNLAFSIKGEYKIEYGQVLYSNVNYIFNVDASDTSVSKAVAFFIPEWDIELTDDNLVMTNTLIFHPYDATDGIYGKWSTDQLFVAYVRDEVPLFASGSSTLFLYIQKDTNLYSFSNVFTLNGVDETIVAPPFSYHYEEPFIIIDSQQSPWGIYEDGKIKISNSQRTYKSTE